MSKLCILLLAASIGFVSSTALAAPLTLNLGGTSYQQSDSSPCVIGSPSCNNPSLFDQTTLASNQSTYTNIGSPIYTVGQIRNIIGNIFSVGIDVNTTTQPMATEILDSFSLAINGVTQFLFNTSTQLKVGNNGSGWSDDTLSGFDLSSYMASATAQFFVTYHNATGGREDFFLASGDQSPSPTTPVPEPMALLLLGLGIAGASVACSRKKKLD